MLKNHNTCLIVKKNIITCWLLRKKIFILKKRWDTKIRNKSDISRFFNNRIFFYVSYPPAVEGEIHLLFEDQRFFILSFFFIICKAMVVGENFWDFLKSRFIKLFKDFNRRYDDLLNMFLANSVRMEFLCAKLITFEVNKQISCFIWIFISAFFSTDQKLWEFNKFIHS